VNCAGGAEPAGEDDDGLGAAGVLDAGGAAEYGLEAAGVDAGGVAEYGLETLGVEAGGAGGADEAG
jgi:hypothetical protein